MKIQFDAMCMNSKQDILGSKPITLSSYLGINHLYLHSLSEQRKEVNTKFMSKLIVCICMICRLLSNSSQKG